MKLELKPEALELKRKHGMHATHSSASEDGHIAWAYTEDHIEVWATQSHQTLASYRFSNTGSEGPVTITSIASLPYLGGYLLLVATSSSGLGTGEELLHFLDVRLKKIVRVVQLPYKITAVEVVFSTSSEDVPNWVISKHLQFFSGLAAIGTEGAYVYLIDLCLDELYRTPEKVTPKRLLVASAKMVDPQGQRENALSNNKHMAILLDERCHREGQYYYRRQDDVIQKVFDEESVYITSLKYLPQAGTLAIGLSFGSFQLWRLYTPVLDYCTSFKDDEQAVHSFTVQEPENDPRNFLYLWVVHDDHVNDSPDCVASVTLYQLSYAKKDLYASFGVFYDDLDTVGPRMDHFLTLDPYSKDKSSTKSSCLVSTFTIANPYFKPPETLSDSFEESTQGNDLSLCVFVWSAESKQARVSDKYWMAIFDLNRWYHAQMPSSIRWRGSSPQVCPYWAIYSLDSVLELAPAQSLLNVEVHGEKVLRFINNCPLPPEEHSYPSALQLVDVGFTTSTCTIQGQCLGWQGQILEDLAQNGAHYLVKPADFYNKSHRARLLPQVIEEGSLDKTEAQRIALLDMTLEHGLCSVLMPQCVEVWGEGEYADQGCTLTTLLDWAWQKTISIRTSLDTACMMLYDWSGQHVDPRTSWQFRRCTEQLFHLRQVFALLISQSAPTTDRGILELELRHDVITLLHQHFEVILWCLAVQLLPEVDELGEQMGPGLFAFPVTDLSSAYRKRRQELAQHQGSLEGVSLLLIDNLVQCEGEHIKNLWIDQGGDGFYPPPSMQAVLYMFLLEDVSLTVKHSIMLYLLQDLANIGKSDQQANTGEVDDLVARFIQRFFLSPGLVHQVQGLWCLDHRDFEEGIRRLVNPSIHEELCGPMHRAAVVNTLLAQGQGKMAARYIHTQRPMGGSTEEQQLYVSVLVNIRNVSQALAYVRECQTEKASARLLEHLLTECQKNKLLGHFLQLNLTHWEESQLEQYLQGRAEPHALEPLLLYYLQHSRFEQAFALNQEMNRMDKFETSHVAQERSAARNRLMQAYLNALPDITRKLLTERQKGTSHTAKRLDIAKPTPLSTAVHSHQRQAMSRSYYVMEVMQKVKEAENIIQEETGLVDYEVTKGQSQKDQEKSKEISLLRTPRTPKEHFDYSITEEMASPTIKGSAAKRTVLSALKRRLTEPSRAVDMESTLTKLTLECVRVLQTPKREHKKVPPSPVGSAGVSLLTKTPQSILKVRRLSKTLLPSASRESLSGRRSPGRSSSHRKQRVSSGSPTSVKSSTENTATPHTKGHITTPAASVTPKQLRFVGLSPTPSPATPVLSSGQVSSSPSVEVSLQAEGLVATASSSSDLARSETSYHSMTPEPTTPEIVVSVEEEGKMQKASPMAAEATDVSGREMEVETTASGVSLVEQVSPITGSSHHKYSMDELPRPDLQSLWKESSIEADRHQTTEVLVDEDITFSLHPSTAEVPSVVPLTSSPTDPVLHGTTSLSETSIRKSVQEEVTSTKVQTVVQGVKSSIRETRSFTVIEEIKSKTPSPEKNDKAAISPVSTLLLSAERATDYSLRSRRSKSPFASPSEGRISAMEIEVSPKIVNREVSPPPATPPLSEKAKSMASSRVQTEKIEEVNLSRRGLRSTASPTRSNVDRQSTPERKTPERRSPSRRLTKLSSEEPTSTVNDVTSEEYQEQNSSFRRKLELDVEDPLGEPTIVSKKADRSARKTPERRSPSRRTKQSVDKEAEGTEEETASTRALRASPSRQSNRKSVLDKTSADADQPSSLEPPPSPSRKSRRLTTAKADTTSVSDEEDVKARETAMEPPPSPSRKRRGASTEPPASPSRKRRQLTSVDKDVAEPPTPSPSRRSKRVTTPSRETSADPTSPSRKTHGASIMGSEKDRGSKDQEPEVSEEPVSQSETPTRRSTRRHTPDRTLTAINEEKSDSKVATPTRKRKTESESSDVSSKRKREKSSEPVATGDESAVEEEISIHSTRGRSRKIPEEKSNRKVATPTRRKKTVSESSDASSKRKREKLSEPEATGEETAAEEEMTIHSTRGRSRRTPDRQANKNKASEVASPTRKSLRATRTPARLAEDEAKLVRNESSPQTEEKEKAAPSTPVRKSKRKPKSPERLNTDEIEPLPARSPTSSPTKQSTEEESSSPPQRSTRAGSKSRETASKSTTKRGRPSPDRAVKDVSESEDQPWSEELGPLRLDVEEEKETAETEEAFTGVKTPQKATTKKSSRMRKAAVKDMEHKEAIDFVFSPPVRQRSMHSQPEHTQQTDANHVFEFSAPTVASPKGKEDEINTGAAMKTRRAQKQRKTKSLYDGSPLLLPATSPVSPRSKMQLSNTQRATASILKRYRPKAPTTRRVRPSLKS